MSGILNSDYILIKIPLLEWDLFVGTDLDKKQGSGAEANGAAEPFVYQSANLS